MHRRLADHIAGIAVIDIQLRVLQAGAQAGPGSEVIPVKSDAQWQGSCRTQLQTYRRTNRAITDLYGIEGKGKGGIWCHGDPCLYAAWEVIAIATGPVEVV